MASSRAVLVVDDHRDVRETVAAVLEAEGYEVRCAENGAQALALLHRRKARAMIIDLNMPVMSGWELLDALHQDSELARIPVVVLSSMHAPCGVGHLDKPVSPDELVAAVDRMCRHC